MSGRGHGENCTYCKRELEATTSNSPLAATRDHVVPRSRGREFFGEHTVWACRQCNHIKGDMLPSEWSSFMVANPEWWRMPRYQGRGRAFVRKRKSPPQVQNLYRDVKLAIIPYEESIMILRHGKKAWRAWKAQQESPS